MRFYAMTTAAIFSFSVAADAAPALSFKDAPSATSIHLAQAPNQSASSQATVRVKSAVLRSGPDTKSKKVTSLPRGTKLQVIGQSGDWTQVRAGNHQGYVSSSLLTMR